LTSIQALAYLLNKYHRNYPKDATKSVCYRTSAVAEASEVSEATLIITIMLVAILNQVDTAVIYTRMDCHTSPLKKVKK